MLDDNPTVEELAGATVWFTATINAPTGEQVTLPVAGGRIVWQADQQPSTRVSDLTLPIAGVTMEVINALGHRVRLTGHAARGSMTWAWELGEYLITSVERKDAAYVVQASDLSQLVRDHQRKNPAKVSPASTINMHVVSLLAADRVDYVLDDNLPLVRVAKGFTIGTDRGKTLDELLTGWGAHMIPHPRGGLWVRRTPPSQVSTASVIFRGGDTGTRVDTTITASREHTFNHVIVEVSDTGQAAEEWVHEGRYSVGSYGWRTQRFDSLTVPTLAHAQLIAHNELGKCLMRAETIPVEAFPDWRLQPYDPVGVDLDGTIMFGRVTGLELPLEVGDTMAVDIGLGN